MAITRSDILNKSFTRNYLGYDDEEVDKYLLVLMEEIEATRSKLNEVAMMNKQLRDEMDSSKASMLEWEEKRVQTEQYVKGLLDSATAKRKEADDYSQQTMEQTQEKAKQIVCAAENKASELVYLAEEKALGVVHSIEERERQIIEKAQRKAQNILSEAAALSQKNAAEPWEEWMK